MPNDEPADDPLEALKTLLDVLAVETEHRDVDGLQAFSDMLVTALNDDGRRYEWTADERNRAWMRQALDSIERNASTPGRMSAQEIRNADPIHKPPDD